MIDFIRLYFKKQVVLINPLRKAVTQNLSYIAVGITYEGRDGFYLRRRKFFYLLDKKLQER